MGLERTQNKAEVRPDCQAAVEVVIVEAAAGARRAACL